MITLLQILKRLEAVEARLGIRQPGAVSPSQLPEFQGITPDGKTAFEVFINHNPGQGHKGFPAQVVWVLKGVKAGIGHFAQVISETPFSTSLEGAKYGIPRFCVRTYGILEITPEKNLLIKKIPS